MDFTPCESLQDAYERLERWAAGRGVQLRVSLGFLVSGDEVEATT